MTDWGKSGRIDTYRATLVDPFSLLDVSNDIELVPSESNITWGYYTDNIYSGSIVVRRNMGEVSDKLIRIYQKTTVDDYSQEREIATMFIDNASLEAKNGSMKTTLSCYSTLFRFSDDVFWKNYNMQKGKRPFGRGNNFGYAKELIVNERGGKLIVADDVDDSAMTSNHLFEAHDSIIGSIRQIANLRNAQLSVDGHGTILIQKYVEPAKKPISFTFDAKNSLYIPGVSYDDDRGSVYNRCVVYYSNSKGSGAQFAELPVSSPYHRNNIGRYITNVIRLEGEAKYTNAQLKNEATKFLNGNKPSKYIDIEHVGIPDLQVGQVVEYKNDYDFDTSRSFKCLVSEISMDLTPGAKCSTSLKVIE